MHSYNLLLGQAIDETNRGFKIGHATLFHKDDIGRTILDGDTVKIFLDGYINSRFLGIDTPEKGLDLPNLDGIIDIAQPTDYEKRRKRVWREINHHAWVKYLENPFDESFDDADSFRKKLGDGLLSYLKSKTGPLVAKNHYDNSLRAREILTEIINKDKQATEQQGREYRFFLRFAFEILDTYGRLLCYLHQDKKTEERGNNESYNELMLKAGYAIPYYIFPNIDPFIRFSSILDAIPDVHGDRFAFNRLIQKSSKLKRARELISSIRKQQKPSLFTGEESLKLLPFELRLLQRREKPNRHVMDLSNPEPIIHPPEDYYLISKEEDRLFIPAEYNYIFEKRGYKTTET